ncbi:MAG: uracil-DNA glycosylase, partial [Candidatus Cloacimonetes bacterium]|nr:uracil-DNA glycosylase [Candidatus Cloacimonadota bacterium]
KLSGINDIFIERVETPNKENLLTKLALSYKNCKKCQLSSTRYNFVYGEGNPDADIMFIGEAPGEQEDLQSRPFVGPAGQLFNKMLAAMSLKREEIYITNIVKCRPPGNRNPLQDEISACIPYLYEQISIIKPKIICALGKVAGNALLKKDISLGSMRGIFYHFQDSSLMVTYHPSALLYHQEWKRPAWEDLKMLMREFNNI